ncbi:MAG: GAF domain-containing protein [Pseudomonadota bacterium]
MDSRRYCPIDVFAFAREQLQRSLEEALAELNVPRLSLAFFDEEGQFDYNRVLHTDPGLKFQKASVHEGLLGLTIRRGEIVIYPHSVDAKQSYLPVDDRTRFEIAGPVLFQDAACAALFSDLFTEDDDPPEEFEELRSKFRNVTQALSDVLEACRKSYITQKIRRELNDLLKKTGAIRGYVAIKDWDSSLSTIEVGDNTDVFISLSENDGVCGYVLQTGKAIYIKNTSAPPQLIHNGEPSFKYISSDQEIKSEIVLPFQFNGSVIGVLNLEATRLNNFRKHRRIAIERCRDELLKHVASYRQTLDANRLGAEFVVGRALNELSVISERSEPVVNILSDVGARLTDELRQVLPTSRILGFLSPSVDLRIAGFPNLSWDDRHTSEQWEDRGSWFYPCEVRVSGVREGLVIVEQSSRFGVNELATVDRLGALASLRLKNARLARSRDARDRLISTMVHDEIDIAISELPNLACRLWGCDNATLFAAVTTPDRRVRLFPIRSTVQDLLYTTGARSYAVDVRDGLTGYSATRGKPFVVPRFSRNEDLEHYGRHPRNLAKIVEKYSDAPQSFAGIPLSNGGRLDFLLRLSKILHTRSVGFSEEDYEVMELLQSIYALRQM